MNPFTACPVDRWKDGATVGANVSASGFSFVYGLGFGDFNYHTKMDLVAISWGRIERFLGNGNGILPLPGPRSR
jgi:hypothetical protein